MRKGKEAMRSNGEPQGRVKLGGMVGAEALRKAILFRKSGGRAALGCSLSGTLKRPSAAPSALLLLIGLLSMWGGYAQAKSPATGADPHYLVFQM
jgi:hypothetical protein